jgi:hypothetical protein
MDGFAVANSARKTPAMATNRPIEVRRQKKADLTVDLFFIGGIWVSGGFS